LFSFFERIKQAGDDIPGAVAFLSTHPPGEARRENLLELAKEGEPALTPAEWKALQHICDHKGPPEPIVVRGTKG
jgi:hypothetical protein